MMVHLQLTFILILSESESRHLQAEHRDMILKSMSISFETKDIQVEIFQEHGLVTESNLALASRQSKLPPPFNAILLYLAPLTPPHHCFPLCISTCWDLKDKVSELISRIHLRHLLTLPTWVRHPAPSIQK